MQQPFLISVFYAFALWQICNAEGTNCATSISCKCTMTTDNMYSANCSSANLNAVPDFNASVRVIDLSNNRITFLPESGVIPKGVIKLNMSKNLISDLSYGTFQGMVYLVELDLSCNKLTYNSSVFKEDVFGYMKSLEFLNIKNNCRFPRDNCSYPPVIGRLRNLRKLLIDGLKNVSFPEEFRNLRKLKLLDLSGHSGRCQIIHLRSGMFKDLKTVWHLNLANCNLRSIENGTFRDLVSLRTLNLSDNRHLSFRIMENVTYDIQFTNLTVLSLKRIHCRYGLGTTLFLKDVKYLINSSIQELYLDGNRLEDLQKMVIVHLPKSLQFVSAPQNRFSWGKYLIESERLQTLEVLDISFQFTLPRTEIGILRYCYDWRGPENTTDQKLFSRRGHESSNHHAKRSGKGKEFTSDPLARDWEGDQVSRYFSHSFSVFPWIPFPVPPNLKIIRASTSSFHSVIGQFRVTENNLTEVHLNGNWFRFWQGPIYGLKNLAYIDLSFNMCANVSTVFFDEFRSLRVLNISNNNLGLVFQHHNNTEGMFKNLINLEYLDLSFNRIFSFPRLGFRNLTNLEFLIFHHNLLIDWNIEINHLTKLKHLDISVNQIAVLNKSFRDIIDGFVKSNNITINMRGNILRCSCDGVDFLEWMYDKRYIFIDFTDYQCRLINDTILSASRLPVLLSELHRDCSSYAGLIAGVMAAILLSSSIMTCGLLYRYRWRLKYLYYVTISKYKARKNKVESRNKYDLDAFVSYANDDRIFINSVILKLETESGLKLCIHGRDFVPGRNIAQNITNAIQRSRRTIIVLTNNYLNSYWCMFEFNMARMESIYKRDGEDVVFMILYQHVAPRDIPLHLMDLIQNNSYIEYPDDEQAQEVFWNKIKQTIIQN